MFVDIKRLRVFVAIAQAGSFTGAAERMNMAQPWVSVQMKQLEESLSLVLLDRSKGTLVKLTEDGERLLEIAKRLLNACSDATREIDVIRHRSEGRLVLGVDPITLYIPGRNELVKHFMERYPETQLSLISEPPSELFDGLVSRRYDLILTSCPAPKDNLDVLPLYEYELQLLVPKSVLHLYESAVRTGNIDNAKLLRLPHSYHPASYSWLESTLASSNIKTMVCPELSYHALIRYCALLGIATLTPDFSARA